MKSVLSHDLRGGRDDVAPTVRHEEIAVGDAGRRNVHTDEDVHSVVPLPEPPNLQPAQVSWLPEGIQDMFAYRSVQLLSLQFLLFRLLLVLLFRWH
jgi:hypothetical protein